MSSGQLRGQQQRQEDEYALPVHWMLDRTYRVHHERFSELLGRRIRAHVPCGRILDVGCGDGKATADLQKCLQGCGFDIRGIDYSERAILLARAMTLGMGIPFEVVDATCSLDVAMAGSRFDVIVFREVIEHLTEDEVSRALVGARDLLRDNGVLVVSVPTVRVRVPAKHLRHYTDVLLRDVLDTCGFNVIESRGFGWWPVDWGRFKSMVNALPKLWRILNPLWREVDVSVAHTILVVARAKAT